MAEAPDERASAARPEPGVIDTLGLAFGLLNRRPYLIWVLIAFDLLIWTGFRLTINQPFGSFPAGLTGLIPEVAERIEQIEFLNAMTWTLPTLLDQARFDAVPAPAVFGEVERAGSIGGLLVFIAIAGSLLAGMTYLTVVGRLVSDEPAYGAHLFVDSAQAAIRGGGVVLAASGLLILLLAPFGVIGGGLWFIGVDPTVLLGLAALILAAWLALSFVFSLPALALGERNIFSAMRNSYLLVQQNFLAVVALLAIVLLIRAGIPHALSIFTESPWSVPFAIVANAYVATGLIAAILLFFQNRTSELTTSTMGSTAALRG